MQSSFSRGPVDHVHSQLSFGQAIFCNKVSLKSKEFVEFAKRNAILKLPNYWPFTKLGNPPMLTFEMLKNTFFSDLFQLT